MEHSTERDFLSDRAWSAPRRIDSTTALVLNVDAKGTRTIFLRIQRTIRRKWNTSSHPCSLFRGLVARICLDGFESYFSYMRSFGL